jgi:membrane fusion protein, multidrug efflux system
MKNILSHLILLLAFMILAGCSGETEQQEEAEIPVRVYTVQAENLTQYLKLTGTITAEKDQILFSKISERIESLSVKPGDRVNSNQIIARQYNAAFAQGVDAARAGVENAEAQYELAEINFKRMERLYTQRAVSTQQFEQTSTQFKAASSALDAARAQLQQAVEQLENSIIKAPFSGVVAVVHVELNQMVPAGQPVAQIIDQSAMKSKIKIASRDVNLIQIGQEVEVSIPSIPGQVYAGKVNTIDQAVDPLSKSLEAEVIITDADSRIKSGMYGEFLIPTATVENSVVVPETSLLSQTEVQINKQTGTQETVRRHFLFVVEEDRAKLKEVQVGLISNSRAQIIGGINFNDRVIVVGNNIVQENQKVNIIE